MNGCRKSDSHISTTENDEKLIKTFSQVGVIHNNAMDHIYLELRKIADLRNKTSHREENGFEISLREVNEITVRYIIDSLNATGFDSYIPYYTKDTIIKQPNFSSRQFSEHANLVLDQDISIQLTNAMNDFETFWRNDSLSYDYEMYDSIIADVVPSLTNELDKQAFTCAVSTAKHSQQYWDKNKNKWDSLIADLGGDQDRIARLVSGPGKDIIYADIAGGMTGLISGAYTGATGGTVVVPGIGTVTGAVAGGLVGAAVGGVGGSAVEAAHSFIKWIINW